MREERKHITRLPGQVEPPPKPLIMNIESQMNPAPRRTTSIPSSKNFRSKIGSGYLLFLTYQSLFASFSSTTCGIVEEWVQCSGAVAYMYIYSRSCSSCRLMYGCRVTDGCACCHEECQSSRTPWPRPNHLVVFGNQMT